jgi:membrane-bound serine protease (ClpP class)
MRKRFLSCCIKLFFILLCSLSFAARAENNIVLLNINGAIGPATQDYIERGLHYAETQHAKLIILQLDTPGGLESATHSIDKAILASTIPVVTFVAPTGARAASAGTFILYASSIAAMAPGTHVGAASPVNILSPSSKTTETSTLNKIDNQNLSTLERKAQNDAAANIISLAEQNGRNAAWAEQAVRNASSLSATQALQQKVVDIIALDVPDLLKKINGRTLILHGSPQTLSTLNMTVDEYKPDWRNQFLSIITNPNIAYILLLIGIYGLFLEFYHPGFILPGVAGLISLLIALYAFQLLPVNYVGFALLLMGIIFMIIEVLITSFGVLGVAGIIAFVMGSILLLDVNSPGYKIAWSLIMTMTALTVLFFLLIITLAIRAMRKKVMTGREGLIGASGEVIEHQRHHWIVRVQGETWQAKSAMTLTPGQAIRVRDVSGITLSVEPEETDSNK